MDPLVDQLGKGYGIKQLLAPGIAASLVGLPFHRRRKGPSPPDYGLASSVVTYSHTALTTETLPSRTQHQRSILNPTSCC